MKLSYKNVKTGLHVRVKIAKVTILVRESEVHYNPLIWRSSLKP